MRSGLVDLDRVTMLRPARKRASERAQGAANNQPQIVSRYHGLKPTLNPGRSEVTATVLYKGFPSLKERFCALPLLPCLALAATSGVYPSSRSSLLLATRKRSFEVCDQKMRRPPLEDEEADPPA